MRVRRLLAMAANQGRRSFRSRASECAATIQEQQPFEGGIYSKKYGKCLKHMAVVFPARAATVATHAWTKLHTQNHELSLQRI